ncbi:gamma-glutamyl-gamma-aminobutyrate hydrolase family protein [Catenovulum sediminis]|uniref:Type 1 glutamine amidotransferase n=1 Tax=Catenovulum sediminis TaxID=1740262 RepID=A0ABV1REJ2_9ALTE|nr:type 1 glutamine amidotransferase [Catenovulum sediminis]
MAQRTRKNLPKLKIGVTGNAKFISPSWNCIRLSLYICGARAVRISANSPRYNERFDAFIISGGDDIHPTLYGEEVTAKAQYDRKRDKLEINYIHKALENHIPILGICRGYQLINVVCGGSLYTDIRDKRRKTSNKAILRAKKPVKVNANSKLARILNCTGIKVNSLHHQAIKTLGHNLQAVAYDRDHFIQAIEHTGQKPILGVQWHPEYLVYKKTQRRLFNWLVREAEKARHS